MRTVHHFYRRAALACLIVPLTNLVPATRAAEQDEAAVIHVGINEGDIRGSDNRAVQAAIDYVANLGGGTVYVGPGRYSLRNAVTLRDHVRLIGTPGKTIFAPVDGVKTTL